MLLRRLKLKSFNICLNQIIIFNYGIWVGNKWETLALGKKRRFWGFLEHSSQVKKSRKEIKKCKTSKWAAGISQLFRALAAESFFFWSSLQGLCCSWPGRDSQWPSSQLTHGICGISLSLHRSARCPCHLCRLLQAYGRMESKRALLWIAPNSKLSCWISFFFFFLWVLSRNGAEH